VAAPARPLIRASSRAAPSRVALPALCAVYVALAVLPASAGSSVVEANRGGSPDWLLGAFRFAGAGWMDGTPFYLLLWLALVLYALVLLDASRLARRAAIAAIAGLHLMFFLAPPLLSLDVFSYIAYARLGVEHDLNPYTHEPLDITGDAVFPFAGSIDASSVYGPLFTLLTYPLAPLPVAATFWLLKALAALCSLGVVALVWVGAERRGRDPLPAAVFVGLNPLVLVHVVGGAHNEALVILLTMAGVVMFVATREVAGTAVAAVAAGVKASAALVVPFLVAGARRRTEAVMGAAAVGVGIALVALIGFGGDALDALGLLNSNQDRSSRWSFPYKTSQLLAAVLPGERSDYQDVVRALYAVAFAAICAWLLLRTWRGSDPIRMAAWATLAILVASAWLVPWYALWLLPLAALTDDRRLWVASVALCAWMLPIGIPL
jgi:alpha-1,6-mannosyltransferase